MSSNGLKQDQTTTKRRPAILMAILLGTLFCYLYREHFPAQPRTSNVVRPVPAAPRLKGKNSVSGLVVRQEKSGRWIAEFDYFFNGEPQYVQPRIELDPPSDDPGSSPSDLSRQTDTFLPPAKLGAHHVSVPIGYAGNGVVTTGIAATLRSSARGFAVIASERIDQVIHWPTWQTWVRDQQLAQYSPDQNLARAAALIDSGGDGQLSEAKSLLEKLLEQNPQFDGAFVELARIVMKSNWSAEGLHQAESLLGSALQIRPDSVNAKILLGYVYAHQRRFAQAEGLFVQAAASKPPNLWLWANWGELLLMEGKADQAIVKYREAIARPMTHDVYDRARADAYSHLLSLFDSRRDFDAMEALYKQRVAEFGPGACYSEDYARFMLQVRGDLQSTIDIARRALNQNCEDSGARQILGLAEYAKWADASDPESAAALNQARVFLPMGARPLYLLATSERTMTAARRLIAGGERIDQKDSEKLTALAYALQNHDSQAARRLLALGASPTAPIGDADIPVALVPVLNEDIQGIRIMRKFGVSYSKLSYRGMTAIEFAKHSGSAALLKALGNGEGSL